MHGQGVRDSGTERAKALDTGSASLHHGGRGKAQRRGCPAHPGPPPPPRTMLFGGSRSTPTISQKSFVPSGFASGAHVDLSMVWVGARTSRRTGGPMMQGRRH